MRDEVVDRAVAPLFMAPSMVRVRPRSVLEHRAGPLFLSRLILREFALRLSLLIVQVVESMVLFESLDP
jgi:hypothetical protein